MLLSAIDWLLACLAITLGSVLQAATGLGAGLIIVPLLALIEPALVPGPVLLASLGLTGIMAWRGRERINGRNLGSLLAGPLAAVLDAGYSRAVVCLIAAV